MALKKRTLILASLGALSASTISLASLGQLQQGDVGAAPPPSVVITDISPNRYQLVPPYDRELLLTAERFYIPVTPERKLIVDYVDRKYEVGFYNRVQIIDVAPDATVNIVNRTQIIEKATRIIEPTGNRKIIVHKQS